MGTFFISGAQFGAMIGMSLGVLANYLGWESIFYTLGSAILAWFVLWVFLVYNGPKEHPRIQEVNNAFDNLQY